jgi:hypothetical protein
MSNVADELGFNPAAIRGAVRGLPLEDWSERTWIPGLVREDGSITTMTPGTVLMAGTIWLHEDEFKKAKKHGWLAIERADTMLHGKMVKVGRREDWQS